MQRKVGLQRNKGLFRKKPPQQRKEPPRKITQPLVDDLKVYFKLRERFLLEHDECELRISAELCQGKATTVHHTEGRGKNLLRVETWKAGCWPCHDYVDVHSKEAKEAGHSKRRNI